MVRFLDEYILTKTCTACGEVKLYVEFHKAPNGGRSGRTAKCKSCRAEAAKGYRQRPEVKEADRRNSRESYARNRTACIARNLAWCRANKESRRANSKRHYETNRQVYIDKATGWAAENHDRHRAYQNEYLRRRYAAKRGSQVEVINRAAVWERDGGVCHICGQQCEPGNWHMDHIHPIARGGAHVMANVAVSHPRCNRRKFTKLVSELQEAV